MVKHARVRAPELVGRGGWINTGDRELSLAALRGRIVVLDFWTFCCVNCLHALDELRELEERHRDSVVIVGVHSPKFAPRPNTGPSWTPSSATASSIPSWTTRSGPRGSSTPYVPGPPSP